jgi:hypothetical protein
MFKIKEVPFHGVLFGKNTTEEQCRRKLAPYLAQENFRYIQNKYGVSLLVPVDGVPLSDNHLVLGDY